jgi:hypothetical protein
VTLDRLNETILAADELEFDALVEVNADPLRPACSLNE